MVVMCLKKVLNVELHLKPPCLMVSKSYLIVGVIKGVLCEKVNSQKNPRRLFYNRPSPKVHENGLVLFVNVEMVVMIFSRY